MGAGIMPTGGNRARPGWFEVVKREGIRFDVSM